MNTIKLTNEMMARLLSHGQTGPDEVHVETLDSGRVRVVDAREEIAYTYIGELDKITGVIEHVKDFDIYSDSSGYDE